MYEGFDALDSRPKELSESTKKFLTDASIPFLPDGSGNFPNPTQPLLHHLVKCVGTLKDVVGVYRLREPKSHGAIGALLLSEFSGIFAKLVMHTFVANEWSVSQHESISTHNKICGNILKIFPEIGFNKSAKSTILHHVCLKPNINIMADSIRTLMRACPDAPLIADGKGSLPLHLASKNDAVTVEIIRDILRANLDGAQRKDGKGLLPLHWAVRKKVPSVAIIEALLDAYPEGAGQASLAGILPLHWAVDNDTPSLAVVKTLVKACPDALKTPSNDGWLPVHRLVDRKNPDMAVLNFLITWCPTALQEVNADGQLALHRVVDHSPSSHPAFAVLLEKYPQGADMRDNDGFTPLHLAVNFQTPNVKIIQSILQVCPSAAKTATADGLYPLHILLNNPKQPSVEVVKLIAKYHPDAMKASVSTFVPKSETAEPGKWQGEWVEKRWSPLSRATEKGYDSIVALFKSLLLAQEAGAIVSTQGPGTGTGTRSSVQGGQRDAAGPMRSPRLPLSPRLQRGGDVAGEIGAGLRKNSRPTVDIEGQATSSLRKHSGSSIVPNSHSMPDLGEPVASQLVVKPSAGGHARGQERERERERQSVGLDMRSLLRPLSGSKSKVVPASLGGLDLSSMLDSRPIASLTTHPKAQRQHEKRPYAVAHGNKSGDDSSAILELFQDQEDAVFPSKGAKATKGAKKDPLFVIRRQGKSVDSDVDSNDADVEGATIRKISADGRRGGGAPVVSTSTAVGRKDEPLGSDIDSTDAVVEATSNRRMKGVPPPPLSSMPLGLANASRAALEGALKRTSPLNSSRDDDPLALRVKEYFDSSEEKDDITEMTKSTRPAGDSGMDGISNFVSPQPSPFFIPKVVAKTKEQLNEDSYAISLFTDALADFNDSPTRGKVRERDGEASRAQSQQMKQWPGIRIRNDEAVKGVVGLKRPEPKSPRRIEEDRDRARSRAVGAV